MSVGTVEAGTRYRLLTGAGSGVMHVWDVLISTPDASSPTAQLGVGGEAMPVADWSETYQASVGSAGLSMVMGCLLDHGMRAVTKVYGEECGVRVWDLHKPWDDKSVKVSSDNTTDCMRALPFASSSRFSRPLLLFFLLLLPPTPSPPGVPR